ncbi:MAG: hypothetical protein C0403_02010 [Desulfobacterium sp.]|nr:hypothetical protein [Desulfobacterium sp.]
MDKMKSNKPLFSLFGKLLIIIILTGFCINLLVCLFFLHFLKKNFRDPYIRNIANYMNYITQDIGIPPSFERAKKIADSNQLTISYKNPTQAWSTSATPQNLENSDRWRTIYEQNGISVKTSHGRKQIHVNRSHGQFTFMLETDDAHTVEGYISIVILIVLLSLSLCASYGSIRWVLRPVKWLQDGVHQVGEGNLDHTVPIERYDELGRLAEAFNKMTERIKSMIQDRDQLLLDVSHELRTPLTRMKVALEFLPEGLAKTNIQEDAIEMESMITAILEEARLRHASAKLRKQPTHLADLISDLMKEYRNRKPRITIDTRMEKPIVQVESELIKIVIRNLLNNAIQYSDPDGPPIKVVIEPKVEQVMLSIQDQGSGIPPQDLPHIFEPFYRVDKSRSRRTGGYGIGLSLCKTIMDAHNGKIEVESTPGKGSTFSLIFDHYESE